MAISRRKFLGNTGKAAFALPVLSLGKASTTGEIEYPFVHQVYVWLKNPDSEKDIQALVEGMRKLAAVKTIRQYHIGLPVKSQRDVVDSSYTVSWLVLFENKEDQDVYQVDPIHLNFVKECSPLWNKVVVHDSIRV